MVDYTEFEQTFGGYSRSQVDDLLKGLQAKVASIKAENDQLRTEIDNLEPMLSDAKAQNKKLLKTAEQLPDRPSYSKLGSQFEEVLRLGEEKASRLVEESQSEAELLRRAAKLRSAELVRQAEDEAARITEDTERRAAEMRAAAENQAAKLVSQANARLTEVTDRATAASREASAITTDADLEIETSRAALQATTDLENAALVEHGERVHREREEMLEEVRLHEAEFEREKLRREAEATELSARLLADAERQAAEISASSSAIDSESDGLERATQERVEQMLADARRISGGILDQAQQRTNELAEHMRAFTDGLIDRGGARLDLLRDEREAIEMFLHSITDARTTDAVLAHLEADLHDAEHDHDSLTEH